MVRLSLTLLHAVIGAGALVAGPMLVLKPSGEALTFRAEWLRGSPFGDYRMPGLFLALVIAPLHLTAAVSQTKRTSFAPILSAAAGVVLLPWSLVQFLTIGVRHWTQPAWYAVFTLTSALALRQAGGQHADP